MSDRRVARYLGGVSASAPDVRWLSQRATAARLGIGRQRLRSMILLGQIAVVPVGGTSVVPVAEVERIEAEWAAAGIPEPTS